MKKQRSILLPVCICIVFVILVVSLKFLNAHRKVGEPYSPERDIKDTNQSSQYYLFIPCVHPEAEFSILDFTTANIRRITHQQPTHDTVVLKSIVRNIENQLNLERLERLESLSEIKLRSKHYIEHEKKIKRSLKSFLHYLDDPNNQRLRNVFYNTTSSLPATLQAILNEKLFDKDSSKIDSLASLRDALHCDGQELQTTFKWIMKIFMAGLWVSIQYRWISHAVIDSESSSFRTSIMISSKELLKQLDNEMFQCQTDERNVITKEMHQIILNSTLLNQETVAGNLLRFLKEKYDTKKWVVIVIKEENLGRGKTAEFPSQLGIFRTSISVNGFFAAAISVDDRIDAYSEFEKWFRVRLNNPNGNDRNLNSTDFSEKYAINSRPKQMENMGENSVDSLSVFAICTSSNVTITTSVGLFTDYLSCSDLEQLEILNNKSSSKIDNIISSASEVNTMELSPLAIGKNLNTVLPVTAGTDDELRKKESIEEKMRQIIMRKNISYYDRVGVADSLLHMLEDTFEDDKKWIVIVISDIDKGKTINYFQSGGVYTASDPNGSLFAAAVSINRSDEDPQVWEKFRNQLETFEFPVKRSDTKADISEEDKSPILEKINSALNIQQHLNIHFAPLWTGKMESAVITTPCNDGWSKEKIFNYTTIVASSDLRWMPIADQDACSQRLIVALPKVARVVITSESGHHLYPSEQDVY